MKKKKKQFKYYCEYCDFGIFSELRYKNHLETKKHKIKFESSKIKN